MSNLRVVILTGSYSPDICGVGDYTRQLFNNINHTDKNVKFELIVARDWSLRGFLKLFSTIKKNFDVVHIQYPTDGYGYSILPMLLLLMLKGKKRIVTLHEYSQRTQKARFATNLLFYFSDFIIFTTPYEREVVIKKFEFVRLNSTVINIASNITSPVEKIDWKDRKFDIAYFGHIRPQKGIEEFNSICNELFLINSNISISLIGQLQIRFEEYYKSLFNNSRCISILNLDDENVSRILQNTRILLLPFPDGISMRRGSFLAGLENDCVVVSYSGNFDDGLSSMAVLFNPSTSFKIIAKEINNLLVDNDLRKDLFENTESFKNNLKWSTIVQSHLNIYEVQKSNS